MVTLNGKETTIKKLTLREVMRLAALADKVRGDLKLTRADLADMKISAEGLSSLISKLIQKCVGEVDFDTDTLELQGTALLLCRELGRLVGVSADDVADATMDEIVEVVTAFWEANSSGPFGQKAKVKLRELKAKTKAIIGDFEGQLRGVGDLMTLVLRRELMQVLQRGGTEDGGTTTSSSPSSETSDGQTPTSSMDSTPNESSSSSPASDTSDDTSLPPQSIVETAEERQTSTEPDKDS